MLLMVWIVCLYLTGTTRNIFWMYLFLLALSQTPLCDSFPTVQQTASIKGLEQMPRKMHATKNTGTRNLHGVSILLQCH